MVEGNSVISGLFHILFYSIPVAILSVFMMDGTNAIVWRKKTELVYIYHILRGGLIPYCVFSTQYI